MFYNFIDNIYVYIKKSSKTCNFYLLGREEIDIFKELQSLVNLTCNLLIKLLMIGIFKDNLIWKDKRMDTYI